MARPTLRIDGARFRDSFSREVTFRGINVSGESKLPRHPDVPSHILEHFFDADDVSFVGRPFDKDKAHGHFARLKRWGYNTLRYVFTWEAVEHADCSLRAAVAGIRAKPGKWDCLHTAKFLSRSLNEQADLPMTRMVSQRDRRSIATDGERTEQTELLTGRRHHSFPLGS